jgi:serine/threonine protein kinase
MITSTPAKTCPKCGAPIPPEAPQGLCPNCLLREVSIPTETGKGTPTKSDLPTRETLAAAFPHLEILELIGQGGMGFVYKARQPKLDRFVALKILPQSLATDPTFTERFTREGRVLAKLSHPNIVTVHDFGQANGFFYLLMEFVNGVNLRQAMQAGRFTPAQALALVPDICEALQYAHTQGILHRDIKPENILLDANGRIKIADFGIAKLLGEAKPEGALTGTGSAIGTPHYMAPEQIEKPAEVDHRADIYSLGVVLYELLTGELPLGKFQPPSEKTPLNPGIDAVVLRALEKEREKRYQSARDVKTGVQDLGAALPQLPPENTFARRLLRTVGVVLLALLGAFAVSVVIYLMVGQKASKVQPAGLRLQSKSVTFSAVDIRPYGYSWEKKSNYFQISSSMNLLPQERLRAWLRQPDGTTSESTSHQITYHRAGERRTSYLFHWVLPESMEVEELTGAASILRQWLGKHVTLKVGEPLTLFGATNSSGGQYSASLEYILESPPADSAQPVLASLRVIETLLTTNYGTSIVNVEAKLDAALPPAHALECTATSLAGLPEATRLSFARSASHRNLGCEWTFPTTFKDEDHEEAVRQLRGATFIMRPGERKTALAVTNRAGDVLRGYLELVPPQ